MIVLWERIQSIVSSVITSMSKVYDLFSLQLDEAIYSYLDIPILRDILQTILVFNQDLGNITIFELMIGTLFSLFIVITFVKWLIGIIT